MKVWGDYTKQYALLRDYVLNLQRTNPDTTMKLDVERCFDPSEPTRQFRRIYLCLGALKKGFKAWMGDLLGLDGSLGDDLDLTRDSNFTFMSDRQKVIDKSKGPLTPATVVLFKAITDEASFYKFYRPSKKRKKYADELSSQKITSGGKLSRVGKTVTYYTCKKPGHNKRSCKNGVGGSQSSQRSVATPMASEASAARGSQAVATPITSQRSVVTPRTSQRSAASPRTSQSSAATAKGK
ncbi:hypothetical protein Tco_0884024 [Tanacetum coccineum]